MWDYPTTEAPSSHEDFGRVKGTHGGAVANRQCLSRVVCFASQSLMPIVEIYYGLGTPAVVVTSH